MTDPTFADLSPNASEVQKKLAELSTLLTAQGLSYGCDTGICSKKINPDYCKGSAICKSGIAGLTQVEVG
jgi:hypothetical protein